MTRKSDRGMKVQLTDSFDDVSEDDAIGDVIGQVADSPLGFDLVQIVIGPLGVDLNQSERGISLVRSTDGYLHEPWWRHSACCHLPGSIGTNVS